MPQMSYGSAISYHAQNKPDDVALVFEDECLSWAALDQRSSAMARAYQELGVVTGDYVSIILPNSAEFLIAVIATWKLGATPNPISSHATAVECQAILDLVQPRLIIGEGGPQVGDTPCLRQSFVPPQELAGTPLPDVVSPFCRAICSGGSTGRAKVIVDKTPASCDPDGQIYTVAQGSRTLIPGPMYHSGPFLNCFWTLLTGGFVVLMSRFDAQRTLALIDEHALEYIALVPTMMHRIWRLPTPEREQWDLSSIRRVVSSGAPCPDWLMGAWIKWLGPERLYEAYGATERVGGTLISGTEWLAHPGSVGKPTLGREIKIVDEQGRELPAGEVGNVLMKPPATQAAPAFFYMGAEIETRDGGWVSLGDMGRLDGDGYLYLTDRKTDMIVSGGANIYPAEIEAALELYPGVVSSAVIGLPDSDLGERLHAIVECDAPIDAECLGQALTQRLAKNKLPRSYEFVDFPLRNEAGKVRRSELRAERRDKKPPL
ncbi:MAG: AMP-binding protein [Halieaceae bacterium]|jgi:bile acid-coenzyme A ligase|nr:AMP-binding protein [Halieaceae bacterium]